MRAETTKRRGAGLVSTCEIVAGYGRRALGAPVVQHGDVLGHGQGDEVAEADEGEDGGEEREGRAGGLEAAGVGL